MDPEPPIYQQSAKNCLEKVTKNFKDLAMKYEKEL